MSDTIKDTLDLMKVSGALACASGRSRDDCPYDRIFFPMPHEAWTRGWDQVDMLLRKVPVGA